MLRPPATVWEPFGLAWRCPVPGLRLTRIGRKMSKAPGGKAGRFVSSGLLGLLLFNLEILDKSGVVGKPPQSELRVHNRTHHLPDLDQRPSVARTLQNIVLPDHRIEHDISETAERELQSKRQSPQWWETSALTNCAQDIAPLTAGEQARHLCVRANLTTGNAFGLEGLSKPEECPHGEASTIFWTRGPDPSIEVLGDLTSGEHPFRLGVGDQHAEGLFPSQHEFYAIESHNLRPAI